MTETHRHPADREFMGHKTVRIRVSLGMLHREVYAVDPHDAARRCGLGSGDMKLATFEQLPDDREDTEQMFKRKKKSKPLDVRDFGAVPNDEHVEGVVRAPHNPRQQLITAEEAAQRTATELVAEASTAGVPQLANAMGVMAARFEQFVSNINDLNRGLAEFKHEVMKPFKEELHYLRYTTGDRLNHVSSDLEKYVQQLDRTMWAALRSQGLTDDQVRAFRTENGMTPETPRGFELEAHMAKVKAMQETIEHLAAQNRRLLATIDGTHQFAEGEKDWVWKQSCRCSVCKAEYDRRVAAQQEVTGE